MKRSAIDIIIPFHGRYEQVRECAEGLLYHTAVERFAIHLVDDGSENADFIAEMGNLNLFHTHRLPEHSGFGAALRVGFDAGASPWVVFLNSDCVIEQSHWLNNLRRSMESLKGQGVKLVSARTNNGGTGSYPECLIAPDGEQSVADEKSDQALPLICCLVNRQLFGKIGGFVKPYPYGWYEDEELFWRMRRHGFSQAVCGSSWVRHVGGATVNALGKEKVAAMEGNRERFLEDVKTYWEGMGVPSQSAG